MDINEELEVLREITKLNPISYMKVLKARKEAEIFRNLYVKYEPNDKIGVDYSTADALEHSLRKQALAHDLEKSWREYIRVENDGYGLMDCVDDTLRHYLNEKKEKTK